MALNNSVGQVDVDLLLNNKKFNASLDRTMSKANQTISRGMDRGLNKVSNSLAKIGGLVAGAFAVSKLVSFGKECANLGSDLQEVQNVVDVSFGEMSKDIDEWASHSIELMGMSETSAKKFAGTFGAMSKSFGFTNNEMVDMSKTLTQLTADVASFYNLDYDLAYTKLKSVYTGETETLKDLGVVMTQNALDQFALANGYGKTTKQMTEQEKVALRYKFVLDKLSVASGDFVRTSDGFANQTRILNQQFEKLKTTIGQGFIQALTPAIKVLNQLIARLQVVAQAFANVMNAKFGKGGGLSGVVQETEDIAGTSSEAIDGINGVGDAIDETSKKASKAEFGFDELNKLGSLDSSSSGGGGAITSSDVSNIQTYNDELEKDGDLTDGLSKKIEGLLSRVSNIWNTTKTKFLDALDKFKFKDRIETIKSALSSFNWESLFGIIGKGLGYIAGLTANIAAVVLPKLSSWWDKHGPNVEKSIDNIFGSLNAFVNSKAFSSLVDLSLNVLGVAADNLDKIVAIAVAGKIAKAASTLANTIKTINLGTILADALLIGGVAIALNDILKTQNDLLNPDDTNFKNFVEEYNKSWKSTAFGVKTYTKEVEDEFGNHWTEIHTIDQNGVDSLLAIEENGQKSLALLYDGSYVDRITKENGFWSKINVETSNGIVECDNVLEAAWVAIKDKWNQHHQAVEQSQEEHNERRKNRTIEHCKTIKALLEIELAKLRDLISQKLEEIKQKLENLKAKITETWENIKTTTKTFIDNLIQNFTDLKDKAKEKVEEMLNSLIEKFADIGDKFKEFGANIIDGFIGGIKDTWEKAKDTVGELADGIKDKFKDLLGIHSPSRVFKEFGRYLDEGLEIGIKTNADDIYSQVSSLSDNIQSNFTPRLAFLGKEESSSNASQITYPDGASSSNEAVIMQQNARIIELLEAINNKENDVYMDTTKVGKLVTKYQQNESRRLS